MRQPARTPNSSFTDEDVVAIRLLEGRTIARVVADMYGVGPETIRKIWRRDTFRHVGAGQDGKMLRQAGQGTLPGVDEPSEEEVAASIARFQEAMAKAGHPTADELLDEMQGKGQPQPHSELTNGQGSIPTPSNPLEEGGAS